MAKKRATAARKSPAKKKATKKKAVKKNGVKKKTAVRKKAKPGTRKRPARVSSETPPEKPASDGRGNVVDINRGVELSISQVSLETGFTRETVSKRLHDAGVQPSGKRRGYPVYRMKDVLPALYQNLDGVFDPDKLKPFERRAFYQGEHDKLNLQLKRGECCSSFEVESKFGRLFKIIARHLDTLPDMLERDVGLGVKQLSYVEVLIDKAREEMWRDVVADEDNADCTTEKRG